MSMPSPRKRALTKPTSTEVLRELKALGTSQNQKVYRRHGVKDPLYGVSYANLNRLCKRIKTDHELAQQLWASGNHDARVLATMIADAEAVTVRLLDSWKSDLDNYVITDAFAKFAAQTPQAVRCLERWTRSKREWPGRAGWLLVAHLARADESLSQAFFSPYLETVERDIHTSQNRVRDAMNSALIAIGLRNAALEKRAIALARRIGKPEVDHGETGCKTPDAEAYIRKARKRQSAARA